jgi:hypothetical protein
MIRKMKERDKEELLDLLMDTQLSPEQIREVEQKLKKVPNIDHLPSIEKMALIRKTLQEMGMNKPTPPSPNFMWQSVRTSIQSEAKKPRSSLLESVRSLFTLPRWQWAAAVIALFVGLMIFQNKTSKPQFGNILDVYSFSPDVTATAYNSTSGDATIIWISGLSDIKEDSKFGEIWQVYSYKKDVSVTAYDSDGGDATIIWVDGVDTDSTSL